MAQNYMRIIFGSDHNGREQVAALTELMNTKWECVDVVSRDTTLDDYIKVSSAVSRLVQRSKSVGIILCGTGAGTAICANKHKGIYAVTCFDPEQAKNAKRINNANVLCIAASTPCAINLEIVRAFLTTHYRNRKLHRIKSVRALERTLLK